ncbi:hypothetical protein [Robertkochia flava]|uniref:hypothetical protein n=1 Tax=Robertkochia flava TaxID=3447986 RepID=UPI001CCC9BFC|nr:hypothetical protein [Robertkochia marina]
MAQDIRDLLSTQESSSRQKMPEGHRKQFRELLDKEFPKENNGVAVFWLRIAAGFILVLAVGIFVYVRQQESISETTPKVVETTTGEEASDKTENEITLGDLSPDLSKIERFYLANINMELASLEMNEQTKQLVSGYMNRLSKLNDDYKALTEELNNIGPNQQTVDALIDNLQLRLDLLYRLKDQLKELKQEDNETYSMQTA